MQTPWGKSDSSKAFGAGITFYGTPSHGGFHVSPELNATMPIALQQAGGWYEEDCECCKVILAFPDRFPKDQETGRDTLKNWFPGLYEQFYRVTIQAGESFIRDEELFHKANAANWIVTAAWGDWQAGVTKGMVGVVATLGGSRAPGAHNKARYFLVPSEEYDRRGQHGFVIDMDRHEETGEKFKATAA